MVTMMWPWWENMSSLLWVGFSTGCEEQRGQETVTRIGSTILWVVQKSCGIASRRGSSTCWEEARGTSSHKGYSAVLTGTQGIDAALTGQLGDRNDELPLHSLSSSSPQGIYSHSTCCIYGFILEGGFMSQDMRDFSILYIYLLWTADG